MLWEAWLGSFCWGSFSFPTVDAQEGTVPMLDVTEQELGAQPWVLRQHKVSPKTTQDYLLQLTAMGEGCP